jgi:uncharacterized iron-regulated membrane protein
MRAVFLTLTLSSCTWLAGDTAVVQSDPAAVQEDPAAVLPKCKPVDYKDTRGEVPWKVGDASAGGWAITAIDASNVEFVRVTFKKGDVEQALEIAFNEAGPGDWSTKDYRLMPAPSVEADPALLTDAMAMLKASQDAQTGPPFVVRKQGVNDPYAGLPPCGPDGNPL